MKNMGRQDIRERHLCPLSILSQLTSGGYIRNSIYRENRILDTILSKGGKLLSILYFLHINLIFLIPIFLVVCFLFILNFTNILTWLFEIDYIIFITYCSQVIEITNKVPGIKLYKSPPNLDCFQRSDKQLTIPVCQQVGN